MAKTCRPTHEVFQKQFMDKLAPEIGKLRNRFDGKIKGFGKFKNKFLKFYYEHILGIHFKYNKNGVSNVNGFHVDYTGAVEKSGIIEFANKVVRENGVYKADLICNGKMVKKGATFFPSHWTLEQTMSKACEAYRNFFKNGGIPEFRSDGKYIIKGLTNEGIVIEMWLTPNMHVTTFYPKF